MKTLRLRGSAKYVVAVTALGLLSSTPGLALLPPDAVPVEALPAPEMMQPVVAAEPVPLEEEPAAPALEHVGEGMASYYGHELAGNRTASGERFDPKALTAAHRTLPLGTKLKVTNKRNGKSVIVRINDRGPFVKKRLIDLSLAAAHKISMVAAGHAAVRIERFR